MKKCSNCNYQWTKNSHESAYKINNRGKVSVFCISCWRKEEKNYRSKFSNNFYDGGFIFKSQKKGENTTYYNVFYDKEKKQWMIRDSIDEGDIKIDLDIVPGENGVPPADNSDEQPAPPYKTEREKELEAQLNEKNTKIANLEKQIKISLLFLVILGTIILLGVINYFSSQKTNKFQQKT